MVLMTKQYSPFESTKRHVLGRPTVKKLLTERFRTLPWVLREDGALAPPAGAA
jgi:hypothetical protein